jgi:osmoprotectant transport system permease protein
MLAFLVPLLGLGDAPALVVLTFYALYPILRSTFTGLQGVPPECIEAAEGLGFSSFQKLWWVELPLALPVIISGMRVATAMTIGIATIAAFIGAGGLGDFITQGLALNDSSLILLGAIPTALLALSFDYGISHLETRLNYRKTKLSKIPRLKKALLGASFLILVFFVGSSIFKEYVNNKSESVVIASKNFTEQYILAELMAQLIEGKTHLKVIRKFNLGATDIVHQALLKGDVDLYPEYSGTAYMTVLKEPLNVKSASILQKVRSGYKEKFNLLWLEPFGFSNSQSLALKKDFAQKHQIYSLSDLNRISNDLKIAAPPEFLKREDGFPGLSKVYGLTFKKIMQVDPNLMYSAIENHKVDVIAAFTTDGKLQKHHLVTLKDDKEFYPPYHAAPVIREAVLKSHPEIGQALAPILGFINEEKMRDLNYLVDVEGFSPAEAARQFLVKFHFIQ